MAVALALAARNRPRRFFPRPQALFLLAPACLGRRAWIKEHFEFDRRACARPVMDNNNAAQLRDTGRCTLHTAHLVNG